MGGSYRQGVTVNDRGTERPCARNGIRFWRTFKPIRAQFLQAFSACLQYSAGTGALVPQQAQTRPGNCFSKGESLTQTPGRR